MRNTPKLTAIDHLVLTVADIDATSEFYERVLGAQSIIFGEGRRALQIGQQKINLHPITNSFTPKATIPQPGSADLCFLTDALLTIWQTHLKSCDVNIIAGPVPRTGAMGPIESIYLNDLDGNLIEIARPLY